MALQLESSGVEAAGTKLASATTTVTVTIMCEELGRPILAKVELRVHARCGALRPDSCLGSDTTEQEAGESTLVLTEQEMKDAKKQETDIICIIGDSFDPNLNDRVLLVARVLPTLLLLGKLSVNPDSLFKALKEKLPNNGCEHRRTGGPGGKARFDQILFDFVHGGGTSTCRRGTGVILERAKDGRNWIFICKSGCSQKFKRVRHSPPVVGGQVDPSRVDWCDDDSLTGFRQVGAGIKTMLLHIFDAVNQASP
jgi:hypothetical protein